MSVKILDPDLKINMALDDIIQLTKPFNCQMSNKSSKRGRKKRNKRKMQTLDCNDHSVPLMSSLGGGYIMVSKKSPLLSPANRRRIANAITNRQINSKLIENAKEIIPANYKLVKTDCGVERVLVPVEGISPSVKLILKRVLENSKKVDPNHNMRFPNLTNISVQQPLQKPPLISNYFHEITNENNTSLKMDVDEDNDDSDIEIVDFVCGSKKITNPPVIDVEVDPNEVKNITCLITPSGSKTLNERFTHLSTSLQI